MPVKPAKDDRPRIWAEGHQNPPFHPRSFALASVRFARESLSALLARCALSACELGGKVAAGHWRVPEARLGRSGRWLPSVGTVGAALRGAGEVLARAGRCIAADDEAVPEQSIFTARPAAAPQPARAVPRRPRSVAEAAPAPPAAAPAPEPEDAELRAIRALIQTAPGAEPPLAPLRPLAAPGAAPAADPRAMAGTAPAPAGLPAMGWRRDLLADTTATLLGYGLLVVSVPVGAVLAGLAHLNGEDLRKLVDEA